MALNLPCMQGWMTEVTTYLRGTHAYHGSQLVVTPTHVWVIQQRALINWRAIIIQRALVIKLIKPWKTLFPHFFLKNKFDKFHVFKFDFYIWSKWWSRVETDKKMYDLLAKSGCCNVFKVNNAVGHPVYFLWLGKSPGMIEKCIISLKMHPKWVSFTKNSTFR